MWRAGLALKVARLAAAANSKVAPLNCAVYFSLPATGVPLKQEALSPPPTAAGQSGPDQRRAGRHRHGKRRKNDKQRGDAGDGASRAAKGAGGYRDHGVSLLAIEPVPRLFAGGRAVITLAAATHDDGDCHVIETIPV